MNGLAVEELLVLDFPNVVGDRIQWLLGPDASKIETSFFISISESGCQKILARGNSTPAQFPLPFQPPYLDLNRSPDGQIFAFLLTNGTVFINYGNGRQVKGKQPRTLATPNPMARRKMSARSVFSIITCGFSSIQSEASEDLFVPVETPEPPLDKGFDILPVTTSAIGIGEEALAKSKIFVDNAANVVACCESEVFVWSGESWDPMGELYPGLSAGTCSTVAKGMYFTACLTTHPSSRVSFLTQSDRNRVSLGELRLCRITASYLDIGRPEKFSQIFVLLPCDALGIGEASCMAVNRKANVLAVGLQTTENNDLYVIFLKFSRKNGCFSNEVKVNIGEVLAHSGVEGVVKFTAFIFLDSLLVILLSNGLIMFCSAFGTPLLCHTAPKEGRPTPQSYMIYNKVSQRLAKFDTLQMARSPLSFNSFAVFNGNSIMCFSVNVEPKQIARSFVTPSSFAPAFQFARFQIEARESPKGRMLTLAGEDFSLFDTFIKFAEKTTRSEMPLTAIVGDISTGSSEEFCFVPAVSNGTTHFSYNFSGKIFMTLIGDKTIFAGGKGDLLVDNGAIIIKSLEERLGVSSRLVWLNLLTYLRQRGKHLRSIAEASADTCALPSIALRMEEEKRRVITQLQRVDALVNLISSRIGLTFTGERPKRSKIGVSLFQLLIGGEIEAFSRLLLNVFESLKEDFEKGLNDPSWQLPNTILNLRSDQIQILSIFSSILYNYLLGSPISVPSPFSFGQRKQVVVQVDLKAAVSMLTLDLAKIWTPKCFSFVYCLTNGDGIDLSVREIVVSLFTRHFEPSLFIASFFDNRADGNDRTNSSLLQELVEISSLECSADGECVPTVVGTQTDSLCRFRSDEMPMILKTLCFIRTVAHRSHRSVDWAMETLIDAIRSKLVGVSPLDLKVSFMMLSLHKNHILQTVAEKENGKPTLAALIARCWIILIFELDPEDQLGRVTVHDAVEGSEELIHGRRWKSMFRIHFYLDTVQKLQKFLQQGGQELEPTPPVTPRGENMSPRRLSESSIVRVEKSGFVSSNAAAAACRLMVYGEYNSTYILQSLALGLVSQQGKEVRKRILTSYFSPTMSISERLKPLLESAYASSGLQDDGTGSTPILLQPRNEQSMEFLEMVENILDRLATVFDILTDEPVVDEVQKVKEEDLVVLDEKMEIRDELKKWRMAARQLSSAHLPDPKPDLKPDFKAGGAVTPVKKGQIVIAESPNQESFDEFVISPSAIRVSIKETISTPYMPPTLAEEKAKEEAVERTDTLDKPAMSEEKPKAEVLEPMPSDIPRSPLTRAKPVKAKRAIDFPLLTLSRRVGPSSFVGSPKTRPMSIGSYIAAGQSMSSQVSQRSPNLKLSDRRDIHPSYSNTVHQPVTKLLPKQRPFNMKLLTLPSIAAHQASAVMQQPKLPTIPQKTFDPDSPPEIVVKIQRSPVFEVDSEKIHQPDLSGTLTLSDSSDDERGTIATPKALTSAASMRSVLSSSARSASSGGRSQSMKSFRSRLSHTATAVQSSPEQLEQSGEPIVEEPIPDPFKVLSPETFIRRRLGLANDQIIPSVDNVRMPATQPRIFEAVRMITKEEMDEEPVPKPRTEDNSKKHVSFSVHPIDMVDRPEELDAEIDSVEHINYQLARIDTEISEIQKIEHDLSRELNLDKNLLETAVIDQRKHKISELSVEITGQAEKVLEMERVFESDDLLMIPSHPPPQRPSSPVQDVSIVVPRVEVKAKKKVGKGARGRPAVKKSASGSAPDIGNKDVKRSISGSVPDVRNKEAVLEWRIENALNLIKKMEYSELEMKKVGRRPLSGAAGNPEFGFGIS